MYRLSYAEVVSLRFSLYDVIREGCAVGRTNMRQYFYLGLSVARNIFSHAAPLTMDIPEILVTSMHIIPQYVLQFATCITTFSHVWQESVCVNSLIWSSNCTKEVHQVLHTQHCLPKLSVTFASRNLHPSSTSQDHPLSHSRLAVSSGRDISHIHRDYSTGRHPQIAYLSPPYSTCIAV